MKHALLIMHPPYATQIIVQLDGSIMLKFELERKVSLIDMLNKAVLELEGMVIPVPPPPEPIHLKGRIIPLKQVLKTVEPDTGIEPPMKPFQTMASCDECGAKGPPSNLIHFTDCSSSDGRTGAVGARKPRPSTEAEITGNVKEVESLTERDTIPASFRTRDMVVLVKETGLMYKLVGGITNLEWEVEQTLTIEKNREGETPPVFFESEVVDVNGPSTPQDR